MRSAGRPAEGFDEREWGMHLGRLKHREAVLVVDGECRRVLVPLGAALGAVITHAGRVVGQAHLDGTYPNRAGIPLAPVDSHTDDWYSPGGTPSMAYWPVARDTVYQGVFNTAMIALIAA